MSNAYQNVTMYRESFFFPWMFKFSTIFFVRKNSEKQLFGIWNNFTPTHFLSALFTLESQISIWFYIHFYSDSEITATPILDNPHLILLFYLTQLFLRELVRAYHLLKIIPMDMSGYFGKNNKKFPSFLVSNFDADEENNWINYSLHLFRFICGRAK